MLNAIMSCIKKYFYASKCKKLLCFLCIAKINFIKINSLIKCKNLTQKIMDTFRENGFYKGKNAHKI